MSAVDGHEIAVVDLTLAHLRPLMRIDALVYPQPWSRRLWKAELGRDNRIYLAAVAGGQLVGYAGALLMIDDAHVTTVVTAPEQQRRGIAALLMVELAERAIAAGATALTLEVRVSNEGAQALYRRFGLAPVGVRRGYYEPGNEDALVMWAHDIDSADYRSRLDAIGADLASRAGVGT